jgi:PAS domain S-box-containing protein
MSISADSLDSPDINNFQKEIILQAPVPIFIVEGAEFIITLSNEKNLEKWQRTKEEVLGKPLFEVFPEGKTQPFIDFLSDVYQRGIGIKQNEVKAEFYRNNHLDTAWFNIHYQPLKNNEGEVYGILAISVEVTEQVLARQKAEDSQKELRQMADAMPHLVWIADESGNVVFYNKRVYEYCGLDNNINKDLLWQTIIHPDDFERTSQAWLKAVEDKNPYSIQHRLKMKDGSYRWYLNRANYTENPENNTIRWFGSGTDIDEQKQTEFEIKQAQEFNRTVLESSPDCMKLLDKKGRLRYMNFNGQCQMEIDDFGKFKNKLWWELWGEENKETVSNAIVEALRGETTQFIAACYTAKGTYKWWDVMVSPVINSEGEIQEIISVSRDISHQKQVEEELKKTQEYLNASLNIANVVLSNVPSAIYHFDKEGNILYANELAAYQMGYNNAQELVAEKDFFQFRKTVNERFELFDTKGNTIPVSKGSALVTIESGKSSEMVVKFVNRKTKDSFWLLNRSVPLTDDEGNLTNVFTSCTDISEQKFAEEDLQQSEEKYRSLFEIMDQGFCIIEVIFDDNLYPVDYRFLEYNAVFEKHTGFANVGGKTVLEIIPNIEKHWIEIYGEVALTGKSTRFINQSEAMNRWFEVYAFKLGDDDKNRVAILFTDISERKKSEQELKASEEKFKILTESIPQMVWMSDEKGNNEYLSSQWEKYAGKVPANEYWTSICHPSDLEKSMEDWKKSIVAGEKMVAEARLRNKEGEYRWHFSVMIPLKNEKGDVIKWIGSVMDIHDQKLKEQKKDEFISIASHEMKTPLTSAKAYLQLMEMTLDENHDAYLYNQKAIDAVERLNKLISELLDASKIQHGKLHYNNSAFDFDKMVNDTIENVQYSSTTHKIIKKGQIEKQFLGDKDRLQQVIINLLTNAIKYSPNADEVVVEVQQESNYLQVSVADKGIGMPEKHLKRVFERYYRVQEHSVQFQGLGIGLYISYDIIMRHNGKMWVESSLGNGSIFHFTLPFVN